MAPARSLLPMTEDAAAIQRDVADLLASTKVQEVLHLAASKPCVDVATPEDVRGVFLTGATGFLGSFLLSTLLLRCPNAIVYCLTRAATDAQAQMRLRQQLEAHGLLEAAADTGRYVGVAGDLVKPSLGLSEERFRSLADQVDVIVHNGALVHWRRTYMELRPSNVLSTLECLRMATLGHRLKLFHLVSSIGVLFAANPNPGTLPSSPAVLYEVPAPDQPPAGFNGGYRSSKWAAEKIALAAQDRGLPVSISRSGYIAGHSQMGVLNVDDYWCRMLHDCIFMGYAPRFTNRMNISPVDYVAEVTVFMATHAACAGKVYHVANDHFCSYETFFQQAIRHGWDLTIVDPVAWAQHLAAFIRDHPGQSQLKPVFQFATTRPDELPTRADGTNTRLALAGTGIVCPDMATVLPTFLSYLVEMGHLPAPPANVVAEALPRLRVVTKKLLSRRNPSKL
eukprot:GGOE01002199.1.p1 GENE.GGOE01002199.1~~GGOE01002199.1.p1  ORF type:complete len:473 (-),score=105.35 GGOE01002199.1:182-1537(-)